MRSSRHLQSLAVATLLGVLAAIPAIANSAPDRLDPVGPAGAIEKALELAHAAGSYRMTADVHQVLVPRASAAAIGTGDTEVSLRLEGEAQVPDRARLELVLPGVSSGAGAFGTHGAGANAGPETIKLLLVKDRAFVGHAGAWRLVDNPLGAAAPTADYLSLLSTVRNVARVGRFAPTGEVETAGSVGASDAALEVEPLSGHYSFELDGPRYAEYLRDRMQTLLEHELPPGAQLRAPESYKRMTGTGELWIDGAGLPRRLQIDMVLPGSEDAREVRVTMRIDYFDFGVALDPIDAPAPGGPDGEWVVPAPQGGDASAGGGLDPDSADQGNAAPDSAGQGSLDPDNADQGNAAPEISGSTAPHEAGDGDSRQAAEAAPSPDSSTADSASGALDGAWQRLMRLAMLTMPMALAATAVVWRRRRLVYLAIAIAVATSLVVTPLVQAASMVRFTTRTSEAETLPEALGELGLAPSPDEPDRVAELARALGGELSGTASVVDCATLPAGIPPDGDEDGDGLDNLTERCLGTDYLDADTDGDTITDTLELQGFTTGSGSEQKTWTTNPLLRDSNRDGMDDSAEWNPEWVEKKPATLDYDGDGVANAWDDDNDGDGVPDAPDESPYKVLDYQSSYEIQVSKPLTDALHEDTYVYVDMQVQPKDHDHLRYTTTYLDWPHDDKAQIQDLDDSKDDVRLIPMLELKSLTQPSLAAEYGLVVQQIDDGSSRYFRILVPLVPLETNGTIVAFQTRMGFTPDESDSLQLYDIRLGWLAQAKLDHRKCEQVNDSGLMRCKKVIDTDLGVVVSYYEDEYRVTGLRVSESKAVQVGLFGMPEAPEITDGNEPDELREMANFVSGLSPAFLYHQHPDLSEVKERFTDPDTPEEKRWGVTTSVAVDLRSYAHQDLAMATTMMTATQEILGAHFNHTVTPTLALAYQEDTGALSPVDGGAGYSVTGSGALRFDLAYNALLTVRQVQLHEYHYGKGSDGKSSWLALTMNEALGELDRRYTPEEQTRFAHYVKLLFLAWYGGQVNFVAVNGQPLVGDKADDKAIFDLLHYPGQKSLPGYVVNAYNLEALGERIDIDGAVAGWREWAAEEFSQSGVSEGFGPFIGEVGSLAVLLGPEIYVLGRALYLAVRTAAGAIPVATEAVETASGAESIAEGAGSLAKTIGRIAIVIAVIVAIISLYMIWSSFHGYSDKVSHLQTDMELASDIAATILIVISLVIALLLLIFASTAVGLLVELVLIVLLYLIVALITGDWNPLHTYNWLTKWLADFILKVAFYTKLPRNNAVSSSGLSMSLGDQNQGTVVGNPLKFTVRLTTTVEVGPGEKHWNWAHSRHGKRSDLNSSWAYSQWRSDHTYTNQPLGCWKSGNRKYCPNITTVATTPSTAMRNFALKVTNVVHYRLAYQKCWWAVLARVCSEDHAQGTAPTKDHGDAWNKSTSSIYVDVLPDDIDGLWGWSEVANPDPDGDGLPSTTERTVGTDPWDWDSDDDGLADGYEHELRTEEGTDPLHADTDSDGLLDAEELRRGTSVTKADTDGDGLSDGDEVCRVGSDGAFRGGWRASEAGGHWVCSNPMDPDVDRDKLPDSTEKRLGLSPQAPNTAPRVDMAVGPTIIHNSATYVLRKPGDTLTESFDVFDDTASAIDGTMTLCAAADTFDAATVTSVTGSPGYTPPQYSTAQQGSQTCTSWDFATSEMLTGERMTATLRTTVLGSASSHKSTPATLTLPYKDPTDGSSKTIQKFVGITVDAEVPETTIVTPTHEIAIDGTSFVVGGAAVDATSWITKVEVAVDGDVSWEAVTGLDTWAWTWSPLPADEEYTIRARSYDAVGHVSADATGKVIVDNTAPGAGFTSVTDGEVLTELQPDAIGGATLRLTGEGDDTVSGASRVSGVARVQLSIDGRPWETVWDLGARPLAPPTTPWSHNWRIDADATGSHTLAVRAVDKLGHVGELTEVEVIVDLVPPAGMVSDNAAAIPVGEPFTLRGHEDETGFLPLVPRPKRLTGTLGAVEGATVWLQPPSPASDKSVTATWLGDVNGDGRSDMAVGMPHDNDGAGRVAIVHGRAGGWPVPPESLALAEPDGSLVLDGSTGLGAHIAAAGDVNSDGLSDILVGDPDGNAVYIVFGRAGTVGLDLELSSLGQYGASGKGAVLTASIGRIGAFVAAAGDINGDGYGDVLVGATQTGSEGGHAYLLPGYRVFRIPSTDVVAAAAAVVPLDPDGAPATGVGDVNGDQLADFVLADPNAAVGSGAAVYLFLGDQSYGRVSSRHPQQQLNPATDAAATFAGGSAGEEVVALGDVDSDGYSDFSYSTSAGPQLVFGREGPGQGTQPPFEQQAVGDAATRFVAAVGDVNADGHDDLVLGAPGNEAQVVLGARPFPSAPTAAATITSTAQVALAPYAAGADCNCDGSSDLLVLPSEAALPGAFLDFGDPPHVDPATLPVVSASESGGRPASRAAAGQALALADGGGTVHVSAEYCPVCANDGRSWGDRAYSSIQAAIASGADKVIVHPGIYRGRIALASGVEVIGSGAEVTIVQPPVDDPTPGAALVTADAATGARLARVTIDGTSRAKGALVSGGADVSLERLVVRNTPVGVTVDGSATRLTMVGATVVANEEGVVATDCAVLDVRNSIFAYHGGAAMNYRVSGCAGTMLNRYNGFWRNNGEHDDLVIDGHAVDPDSVGQGMVPADPRFVDPTHHDYHLATGSPAVDAGDISDSPPPGTGLRVDLGSFERGQASFYADASYTDYGVNDGLEWGVDAFDAVSDAVTAMQTALPAYGCKASVLDPGGCSVQLAVGVGPGTYDVQHALPSNLRLVGSGPEVSTLRGPGTGSVLTLTDIANSEISGLTITGFGTTSDDAAIKLVGATTGVTVARNVIKGGDAGPAGTSSAVLFTNNASGLVMNNTLVNSGNGAASVGRGTQMLLANNILYNNDYGVYVENGSATSLQVVGDFNLYYGNTRDVAGSAPNVVQGGHDLTGQDPRFVDAASGDYRLQDDSPAINGGNPDVVGGGGAGAYVDIGYHEARAVPLALLFGQEGQTCATGNSGVAKVEVGLAHVTDPRQPVTATLPSTWSTAVLSDTGAAGTYWTGELQAGDGLGIYRLYERGTDVAGNVNVSYLAEYAGDDKSPVVTWLAPADGASQKAAALELVAAASDYVTTPLGTAFNVTAVRFEVDGSAVEAHWSTAPWSADSGEPRVFRAVVPLAAGAHTVTAVVGDAAGHVTRSAERTVTLTGADVATIYAPEAGSATNSATLTVRGHARFSGGDKEVTLYVDGVEAGAAELADPTGEATEWTGEVALTGEVTHTLQAVAAGGSLADAAEVPVRLDLTDPTVQMTSPDPDDVNPLMVQLVGQADDVGLQKVEVSVDGGFLWSTARVTTTTGAPSAWGMSWQAPAGSDGVRYPVRVRAVDQGGNTAAHSQYVTVDNVAPSDPTGVGFEACAATCTKLDPGDAFNVPEQLEVSWDYPVVDGSGPAAVHLAVTQSAVPPADDAADWRPPTTDSTYKALVVQAGTYYVHMSAADTAGNRVVRTHGPFYAGMSPPGSGAPVADWVQPIHVDGRLNVAGREWVTTTQLMDVDPRARQPQELYVAWDATDLFVGWSGALWATHGTAWIYLDTGAGGTTAPWAGDGLAEYVLPIEADHAIEIASSENGGTWRYDEPSGGWQETSVDGFAFANGALEETEVRVPRAAIGADGAVRLVAVGTDSDGRPQSVFPTSNALSGGWSDAYEWPALSAEVVPNAGQPRGHHVRLSAVSHDSLRHGRGPGDMLEYSVLITNIGLEPVSGMKLDLRSTDGVTLENVEGVAGPVPSPADHWVLDLDPVPTGHRDPITVTARLARDLDAINRVTVTAALDHVMPASDPDATRMSHGLDVDSHGPTVVIWEPAVGKSPAGATMQPGVGLARGTAIDRGGGVKRVEVRVADGEWRVARGTHAWDAEVIAPVTEGTFELAVRAVDQHGQVGKPETVLVTVDDLAPTATMDLPGDLLTGHKVVLQGTAADPYPQGGDVARVEVQIDDGPWRVVSRHGRGADGEVNWSLRWRLPREEGIPHELRVRATDPAGNVGVPTAAATVTVDSVRPRTTIEHPRAGEQVPGDGLLLVWGNAADGWGIDRVEVSADGGRTWHDALLGADAARLLGMDWPEPGPVAPPGPNAIFLPRVSSGEPLVPNTLWAIELSVPAGEIILRSRAVDRAGNVESLKAPVRAGREIRSRA